MPCYLMRFIFVVDFWAFSHFSKYYYTCISIIPMIFILCFRFFLIHFGGRTHKIFMRLSGCKINLLLQGRNKKCVSTECCWGRFYNLHVYQRQRHVCGALLICVHLYTHTYTCKFKANKKSPQK